MRGKFFAAWAMWLAISAAAIAETQDPVDIPVADGRTLSAQLYAPGTGSAAPAVIVLHTKAGSVECFDSDYARSLTKENNKAKTNNNLHPDVTGGSRIWSPGIT